MPTREIEEFAKKLVERVRDKAIHSCDMNLRLDTHYPAAMRWKTAVNHSPAGLVAHVVVPDTVDNTIFWLLHAIDDGLLDVSFRASNGDWVNLTESGARELAGWYMGSDGWRSMYSKERFYDDFADLKGNS